MKHTQPSIAVVDRVGDTVYLKSSSAKSFWSVIIQKHQFFFFRKKQPPETHLNLMEKKISPLQCHASAPQKKKIIIFFITHPDYCDR